MMHAQARLIKQYKKYIGEEKTQDIRIENDTFIINENQDYFYKPEPTPKAFHADDSRIRLIMGPYGSGKTTGLLAEIVFKACQMPKLKDGIRRCKWAIIRNTAGELETTSYASWTRWFSELGSIHRNKKPILQLTHRFNDGNGIIELQVIFLALDREADIKKLKSLELTGAYINETSEIPLEVFTHLKGRIGRFPSKSMCPEPYWSGIILDTNPPNQKHWIHHLFEIEKPDSHIIYKQPPGLIRVDDKWQTNPEAENLQNLEAGYYEKMATGSSEEFIKVFCLGQYGTVLAGKKVFPEYNDDVHSKSALGFMKDCTVYVGMDFGTTPCAVFVQEWPNGQTVVVKSITSSFMGIRQFMENKFNPFVSKNLRGFKIGAVIGDPAGNQHKDTDYTTCFEIVREYGYDIDAAPSNLLTPRLEAVRFYLNRMVDGLPLLVVDREGAEEIREGFLGGYQYKRKRSMEESYYDEPEKNKYSHPMDGLQYILLWLNSKFDKEEINGEQFVHQSLRF